MLRIMLRGRHFIRLISSEACPIRVVNGGRGEHFRLGSLDELKLSTLVPLAGRDFLASSRTARFPKFLAGPTEDIPLFLKAQLTADDEKQFTAAIWGTYSRDIIDTAYKRYEKHGVPVAILFRGMPIKTPDDFSNWVNALNFERLPYVEPTGLTPEINDFVRSGSSEPSDYNIEPHNEQAYMPRYPNIFAMCMFRKAVRGGETAIVDNREILRKLDPRFMEKCERKQLRYWKYLPDARGNHPSVVYKSWQDHFRTDDKTKIESELKSSVYNFEWDEDNNLVLWYNRTPFIHHPKTKERLWFNQVAAGHCSYLQSMPIFQNLLLPNREYPFHCTYGDGEEIETECLHELRRIKWENAVGFEWQEGDVLFLDNLVMQHSRLSFQGERDVGISILNMN